MMHLMSQRRRGPITAEERDAALAFSRNLKSQAETAAANGWLRARDTNWVRERCDSFERLSGLSLEVRGLSEEQLWDRVPEAERAEVDKIPSWDSYNRRLKETAIMRVRNSGSGWPFDVAGLQVGLDRMLTEVSLQDAGKGGSGRRARHVRQMLATAWLLMEATGMCKITDSSVRPDPTEE